MYFTADGHANYLFAMNTDASARRKVISSSITELKACRRLNEEIVSPAPRRRSEKVTDVCRRLRVSEQTRYRWKKQHWWPRPERAQRRTLSALDSRGRCRLKRSCYNSLRSK
jgi:hypothetical protein